MPQMLRASDIQVRNGSVRFIRFGNPNPVKQSRDNTRAPARRGLWAFPWPANDFFFSWHKWDEVLPKHLAFTPFGQPRDKELGRGWLVTEDEYEQLTGKPAHERFSDRDNWIRDIGWDVMGVTDIWHDGAVHARFDPNTHLQFGTGEEFEVGWYRHQHATGTYLKALRRSITQMRAETSRYGHYMSFDHLEVFLEA